MKYLHIVWYGIVKVLTWLLVLPILFYQKCITPYTPPSCRFQPTCSEYAKASPLKGPYFRMACLAYSEQVG